MHLKVFKSQKEKSCTAAMTRSTKLLISSPGFENFLIASRNSSFEIELSAFWSKAWKTTKKYGDDVINGRKASIHEVVNLVCSLTI